MAICYYEDGYQEECSWADAYLWPLADKLDQSQIATIVKESTVIVPWAGAVHLLALAAIGGLILMVDFRVLGYGLKSYQPAELERRLRPALIAALIVMVISGTVLGLGEVMRLYESPPYWMKMAALLSALIFAFAVRPSVYRPDRKPGVFTMLAAAIAIGVSVVVFVQIAAPLAWWAMAVLIAAIALIALVGRTREGDAAAMSTGAKLTAATSLALWMTVAVSGRWIAFY